MVDTLPEGADAVTVVFDDPARHAEHFEAGQYLTLEVPINGERVPGGLMSNWIHDQLSVDHFTPGPPRVQGPRRLLLVAGGSGIVPLRAVARQVLHDEPNAKVPVDTDLHSIHRALVCGPDAMRAAVRQALLAGGLPADRLLEESFVSPRRGAVIDQALNAGIALPFSYRSGACGACRVHLTEQLDHVVLDEPNTVTPEDRSRGEVPACLVRLTGPCRFRLP